MFPLADNYKTQFICQTFRNSVAMEVTANVITVRNIMAKIPETIGGRLEYARIAAGYRTAKEFSDKNGLKQPTYHMHETEGRGLKLNIAKKYAALLGNCDEAWLLTGKGVAPIDSETRNNPLISQSKINQEIGRRLTAARENRKLTIQALAKKVDVGIDVIERCEHGDEMPANDVLRHLEDVLDAPLIIEGEARSFREDDLSQISRGQMIDEYDARGGMGDGERPDHDNPVATWMVPGGHFGRGDLVIMGSGGNSMEPTLLSGDRVVVDRADRDASHGGIFVIRDNESSKIKRIETVTGSKPRRLRILSENRLHPPEEIDLSDDLIIGRVVGLIRRF